jgi:hypothetical protein
MQSTVNDIEKSILIKRRGRIYFAADFASLGNPETVKKSLLRLEKSGFLVRLAHGIYLFPKIDKKLGLGVLHPSVEEIAKAIAERDKARMVPTGVYALNALGLSTQIPVNAVFLTDGAPRKIKIYNQKILFKHVVPKNFAYKSDVLMLVVSALKEIGNKKATDEDLAKIKLALSHDTKENILADLKLAPVWIRKIIMPII